MLTAAVVLLVVVCVLGGTAIVREVRVARRERVLLHLVATFGPAIVAAERDPQALLAWFPVAEASRRLWPESFRELDRAVGGRFPFADARVQTLHARVTTEWLSWERSHDLEYKLKAAEAERELERAGEPGTPIGRARLATIEGEQLERYQARYQRYVETSKALAALEPPSEGTVARAAGPG